MAASLPVLFPQPQEVEVGAGRLLLTQGKTIHCSIVLAAGASAMERMAADVVRAAIGARSGLWPSVVSGQPAPGTVPIWVGESARPALEALPAPTAGTVGEGYVLQVTADGVAIRGLGGGGTLYGAQTLAQLLSVDGVELTLPLVTIRDWPQFRYRGLYLESKWGPDRMTLSDWQDLIDHMASLKMNLLGVGIYGCWNIQYDQKPTEFMLISLKKYPDLKTPKTISYYSAREAAWKAVSYLPTMYEEDFFGEVVAYGKQRNVIVRPHFNSLGHNTLIPRLYPEISARDAQGWPTGYGFCLSNPATLETMNEIVAEIADRYLLPHGVDYFHLGLDEVWDMIGVYPHHPQRRVSPWCECEHCRKQERHVLITEYVLGLLTALKAAGMRHITLWHDQLNKMGVLSEEFVQQLELRGLKNNVILNWWTYGVKPFDTIRPELGLRRFVTPMTGYYFWSPYRSNLINIESLSRVGATQGAEGLEAYCTHDEAFDGQQRLLADCGWNMGAVSDVASWQEKYARYVFGHAWESGLEALKAFDQISTPGSHLGLIWQLSSYPYTYVSAERDYPRQYPQEPLRRLIADPAAPDKLAAGVKAASEARSKLEDLLHAGIPHYNLAAQLVAEAWRSEGLVRIFEHLLNMHTSYCKAREARAAGQHQEATTALQYARGQVIRAMQLQERVAVELEETKAKYLLPQIMREWSTVRPFLISTLAFLREQLATDTDTELPAPEWADLPSA
jgi:hypothetical protein